MARAAHVLVVAPGAETSWSLGPEVITQPTVVAVDEAGAIVDFGSEAALTVAQGGPDLQLLQPFSSTEIYDLSLTTAYLRWLVDRSGLRYRHTVVTVLVPASPEGVAEDWRQVCDKAGVASVMVLRPVAAASGLGLEVDSGVADMIVDIRKDAAEVAVVADGSVLFSRPCDDPEPHQVASLVRSALVQIDPDLEWDVLSGGIQVVGDVPASEWSDELGRLVGVRVAVTTSAERVLFGGARNALDDIRPYLSAVTPGVGRFLKGVLAGFGH